MYHFENKNSETFSAEGPRENVWRPHENVSPGPAVALDGPAYTSAHSLIVARSLVTLLKEELLVDSQLGYLESSEN